MSDDGLRTPRLSLRRWRESDLEPFAAINSDPQVMRWFPSALDRAGSDALAERIEAQFAERGFGLCAVEVLESERGPAPFVGFVGLTVPRFTPPFAAAEPCVEIGWRLARPWWGLGIASEGAAKVLRHAFVGLHLDEVVSFTVPPNLASQAVMARIGMRYDGIFMHPSAEPGDWWAPHVLYRLGVDAWSAPTEASGRTSP